MIKISSQLERSQLAQKLHQNLVPFIERDQTYLQATNNIEAIKGKLGKVKRSELELYCWSVFLSAERIYDSFKTLEDIYIYLRNFPTKKRYEKAGIRQINYIRYHYFYALIMMVQIVDLSLILTNKIFRLGVPERLCSLDSIGKNEWVISAGIDKFLMELNTLIKPYRQPRNYFIHRRETEIKGKELLSLLEKYDYVIKDISPIEGVPLSYIEHLYKEERVKICKELEAEEIKLFYAVNKLFSALLPIYLLWHQKLQRK